MPYTLSRISRRHCHAAVTLRLRFRRCLVSDGHTLMPDAAEYYATPR